MTSRYTVSFLRDSHFHQELLSTCDLSYIGFASRICVLRRVLAHYMAMKTAQRVFLDLVVGIR